MVLIETVLLCEALGDLTVSIGQFHYQILTFFCSFLLRACASLCVFSIVRCVYIICFVVASFALWFCDCAILLSIALRDNDIKIQRRHIKLEKDELERQLATNDA